MSKLILIFFTLLVITATAQPVNYTFGKQILIDATKVSGSSDLTNFPVLVSFTDPDLRSVANGGNVQNANGYDIIFTSADCSTQLNHQVEKYNAVTGEYIAWVNVPALSSSVNTNLHMYYGNASVSIDPSADATWKSDYEAVWHMNNDPSTTDLKDYTGNGINGTSFGGMTSSDLVAGKIGNAIDFDGANDYFALASKSYNGTGAIPKVTVSAWVNTTHSSGGAHDNWSLLDFDRSEFFNVYIHGDGRLAFSTSRTGTTLRDNYGGSAGDLNDGAWHYITAVYDGSNKILYIDGTMVLSFANAHGGNALGTSSTRFGFIGEGSEANSFNGSRNNIYYNGKYDEIRFLENDLSADWIKTEYNNQNAPASFYTVSTEMTAAILCATLPIELIRFEAKLIETNQVKLEWATASEVNNDYFTIEKSTNGRDWQTVVKIKGADNSSRTIFYTTHDNTPYRGISYYRLKQTDFDGSYAYGHTLSIEVVEERDMDINVYPNPTNGLLNIKGSKFELEMLTVYSIIGNEVTSFVEVTSRNETNIVLDLSNLKNGIYFIKTKTKATKINKQ